MNSKSYASFYSAAKAVAALQDKGILQQQNKTGKAKIYSYKEYLKILRNGTLIDVPNSIN